MVRFCRYVLLLLSLNAYGQGASPEINAPYQHPSYERWQRSLEGEGREVYERRDAIVAAVGLRAGMAVADIGAGTGLFTRLFAEKVGPGGRVYAVDIAEEFLRGIERRARGDKQTNIVTVHSTQADPKLAESSVDLVFICDAYHHFEQPKLVLAAISRALRPDGTLVVIDYERIPGVSGAWVLQHVRGGKDDFRREIEAAGFRFVEEVRLMQENYFLRFTRG
jgi:ubiquinone/menaquinone biosynthesis C-methylase UbiE